MAYPVEFDVTAPEEPSKLVAMLVIAFCAVVIALGYVAIVIALGYYNSGVIFMPFFGTIFAMPLILATPLLAAMVISLKGGEQYLAEAEQGPIPWLRHVMGFFSWISFASGKFPASRDIVDLQVQPGGTPTVGSALLRFILVIPLVILLVNVGILFVTCWSVTAVSILVKGAYPEWAAIIIHRYLRATARVLAYAASLVDEYPPFPFSVELYTSAEGKS